MREGAMEEIKVFLSDDPELLMTGVAIGMTVLLILILVATGIYLWHGENEEKKQKERNRINTLESEVLRLSIEVNHMQNKLGYQYRYEHGDFYKVVEETNDGASLSFRLMCRDDC